MKRISKAEAKKRYNAGKEIMLVPCKLRCGEPWHPESHIKRSRDYDFKSLVNSFTYYNCCYEAGYYPHYYIEA